MRQVHGKNMNAETMKLAFVDTNYCIFILNEVIHSKRVYHESSRTRCAQHESHMQKLDIFWAKYYSAYRFSSINIPDSAGFPHHSEISKTLINRKAHPHPLASQVGLLRFLCIALFPTPVMVQSAHHHRPTLKQVRLVPARCMVRAH